MKKEINNENKAKFFALYYDQDVMFQIAKVKSYDLSITPKGIDVFMYVESSYLTLKPLSKISDEDAFLVSVISENIGSLRNGLIYIESYKHRIEKLPIVVSDYLRSKGYALPWMGSSVNEMVEAGWIKLSLT